MVTYLITLLMTVAYLQRFVLQPLNTIFLLLRDSSIYFTYMQPFAIQYFLGIYIQFAY